MGTLIKVGADGFSSEETESDADGDSLTAEQQMATILLKVLCDGSPLVRAELAIGEEMFLLMLMSQSVK